MQRGLNSLTTLFPIIFYLKEFKLWQTMKSHLKRADGSFAD